MKTHEEKNFTVALPVSAAGTGVPYQTYTNKFTPQNVSASYKHKGAYNASTVELLEWFKKWK